VPSPPVDTYTISCIYIYIYTIPHRYIHHFTRIVLNNLLAHHYTCLFFPLKIMFLYKSHHTNSIETIWNCFLMKSGCSKHPKASLPQKTSPKKHILNI